jgi:hypothetical protein
VRGLARDGLGKRISIPAGVVGMAWFSAFCVVNLRVRQRTPRNLKPSHPRQRTKPQEFEIEQARKSPQGMTLEGCLSRLDELAARIETSKLL